MLKASMFGTLCALALCACQPMTTELSSIEVETLPKPRNLFPPKAEPNIDSIADKDNIGNGLQLISSKTDELGFRHMKYQAIYQGVPVWAAVTIIHINKAGKTYRVDGDIPVFSEALSTNPSITAKAATTVALAALDGDGWSSLTATLFIYADSGRSTLVWQIECLNAVKRKFVLVDANTAQIVKIVAASNT